jgi:hypothetical protein
MCMLQHSHVVVVVSYLHRWQLYIPKLCHLKDDDKISFALLTRKREKATEYERGQIKGRKETKYEDTKEIIPHRIKTGVSTRIYENYLRFVKSTRSTTCSLCYHIPLCRIHFWISVALDKTSITTNRLDASQITIYLWVYSPFVGPWPLFSFLIIYTVGRTPWAGDQPVAMPLPTHRTT